MYYDRTHRNDPSFVDNLDTIDLDFQHRIGLSRNEVIWGSNYRFTNNNNAGKGVFALQPPQSRDNLASGFVQDQIAVLDSLRITLGTKFEHNDFSGFEVQPNARAAWELSPRNTVWGAVSHATRVPTRMERDLAIDVTNPAASSVVRLLGNKDFDSEKLNAYEVGYRSQILKKLSLDLSTFHNRYTGLASLESGTNFVDPVSNKTIVPIVNRNLTDGTARGVETLLIYSPLPSWRLTGSHSYLSLNLDPKGIDRNRGRFFEGATPRHQVGLRSFLDLPHSWQLDAQFRHLTAIRQLPSIVNGTGLPGYSELDARLAWRGWKNMEISLVGQNLLHPHHAEFGAPDARGEIPRSVYGKVTWGF